MQDRRRRLDEADCGVGRPAPPIDPVARSGPASAVQHRLVHVDDLLDLSRLDAGSRVLKPVRIVVRDEIDAVLATLIPIAQKKKITIENKCDADLRWPTDQRSFKQIIINLVNNAVKFSPDESTVRIEVTKASNLMTVSIHDQGVGIEEGDRERILIPFGRGERAESEKIDGVGLGLTIVSELLKLQGGSLIIDSEPGRGSVFAAVFPMGIAVAEDPSEDEAKLQPKLIGSM